MMLRDILKGVEIEGELPGVKDPDLVSELNQLKKGP